MQPEIFLRHPVNQGPSLVADGTIANPYVIYVGIDFKADRATVTSALPCFFHKNDSLSLVILSAASMKRTHKFPAKWQREAGYSHRRASAGVPG